MEAALTSHEDFLLATAVGRVSFEELLRVFKNVVDTATERGLQKILMDFSAVTGELSSIDLYEIGKTMAEHCKARSIHPKVAVVGNPPLVTGFGAQVASNRGLVSMTFSETEPALKWLGVAAPKAYGF